MTRRARVRSFAAAAALVLAGVLCAVLVDGLTGDLLGLILASLGIVGVRLAERRGDLGRFELELRLARRRATRGPSLKRATPAPKNCSRHFAIEVSEHLLRRAASATVISPRSTLSTIRCLAYTLNIGGRAMAFSFASEPDPNSGVDGLADVQYPGFIGTLPRPEWLRLVVLAVDFPVPDGVGARVGPGGERLVRPPSMTRLLNVTPETGPPSARIPTFCDAEARVSRTVTPSTTADPRFSPRRPLKTSTAPWSMSEL